MFYPTLSPCFKESIITEMKNLAYFKGTVSPGRFASGDGVELVVTSSSFHLHDWVYSHRGLKQSLTVWKAEHAGREVPKMLVLFCPPDCMVYYISPDERMKKDTLVKFLESHYLIMGSPLVKMTLRSFTGHLKGFDYTDIQESAMRYTHSTIHLSLFELSRNYTTTMFIAGEVSLMDLEGELPDDVIRYLGAYTKELYTIWTAMEDRGVYREEQVEEDLSAKIGNPVISPRYLQEIVTMVREGGEYRHLVLLALIDKLFDSENVIRGVSIHGGEWKPYYEELSLLLKNIPIMTQGVDYKERVLELTREYKAEPSHFLNLISTLEEDASL